MQLLFFIFFIFLARGIPTLAENTGLHCLVGVALDAAFRSEIGGQKQVETMQHVSISKSNRGQMFSVPKVAFILSGINVCDLQLAESCAALVPVERHTLFKEIDVQSTKDTAEC